MSDSADSREAAPAHDPSTEEGSQPGGELESAFAEAVREGSHRLHRSWSTLLATGAVGGIDLSIGVIALLVVKHETGSSVLGAVAFTVGFIALTLARSELFTENFFVPVAAVVAQEARIRNLVRLWAGTLVMNLAAGWLAMALLMSSTPSLSQTAQETSAIYMELGIGWRSFSLAMLGGMVITVMTWIERNTASDFARVVGAATMGFVLVVVPLNHVIVSSLEMFAALIGDASFGYLEWLGVAAWAALGNSIGGLTLVTLLRLVQVGRMPIQRARERSAERAPGTPMRSAAGVRIHDDSDAGVPLDAG